MSVLAGRALEFGLLRSALTTVEEGNGRCVVVTGEAGIGKSRILSELCRLATAKEFLVLEGRCYEQDLSFSYTPLTEMLRSYFARRQVSEILDLLGPLSFELSKLLPELRVNLTTVSPLSVTDPRDEKRQLFEALAHFLWRQTETGPVLMIVEDLHWSDDLSLEFLLFLSRRITTYPILLLLSYRSEEMHPGLTRLLAGLDRERSAQEIRLQRLTREEVEVVLRALPGAPEPIPVELLETIYKLAEGNPFYTEELFCSLVTTHNVSIGGAGWEVTVFQKIRIPRTLQRVVQLRVRQLDQLARHVVKMAAVYGRRFDIAVLQQLSELSEEEMLQVLKSLIGAYLIVEASAEQFSFRHALTREALYSNLLSRERRALHRQIAMTIERVHAGSLEARLEELSYHFHQAGMWDKVLQYAQRAVEREQALNAPRAVVKQSSRALEAAYHLSIWPPTNLYRARGLAQDLLGEFELARADLETALQLSRDDADGAAEWQILLDLGLLWASRDYRRTRAYYQEALTVAHKLGDPAKRAHNLNRLGNLHTNAEEPLEGKRLHEQALAIFEDLMDQQGVAETLDLLGLASLESGDYVQSETYYGQAIRLFEELGDRRSLVSSMSIWASRGMEFASDTMVTHATTLADSLSKGERALSLAREIGWRAGEAYSLVIVGGCLSARGDYEIPLALMQEALDVAQEIEHRQWTVLALCGLGFLHHELGLPQAVDTLEQALQLASETASQIWVRLATGLLASSTIAAGQLDQAEHLLDTVLPAGTPTTTMAQRLCWQVRAELVLVRGQADLALEIVDRLIASAPNCSGKTVIPELWRLRGEALTALRRWQEAEHVLQVAASTAAAQGRNPLRWPIHVALGRLYQKQSQHTRANDQFSVARHIIEEVAASITDKEVAEAFRRRANAHFPESRPASGRQRMKQAFDGLTVREREVATLISQGKTNRQIARALVISERTVEAHVTNILSKLDFTSRTQVAAWAIKKGLAKLQQ